MTNVFYSTVADVIDYTGIEPMDLKKDTEEELNSTIEKWLVQVKALIDIETERDFHKELADAKIQKIDEGLHNIALRIAANMVMQAQIRKQTSTMTKDSNLPQVLDSTIMTDNQRKELEKYKVSNATATTPFPFFIRRVRNASELQ